MSTAEDFYIVLHIEAGPEKLEFIEIEDSDGKSVDIGEWVSGYRDGLSAIKIQAVRPSDD